MATQLQLKRATHRKQSILRSSPRTNGILDVLSCVEEPRRYSSLRLKSKIYFKKSFITHLKFCIDKGLVENTKIYGKRVHRPIESWFIITKKGKLFQEMIA